MLGLILAAGGCLFTVLTIVWTYQAWMRARWCKSEIRWKKPLFAEKQRDDFDKKPAATFGGCWAFCCERELNEKYQKGHDAGYASAKQHYETKTCVWCQLELCSYDEHRHKLCLNCQATRRTMLSNVAVPPRHPGARPNQESP